MVRRRTGFPYLDALRDIWPVLVEETGGWVLGADMAGGMVRVERSDESEAD